MVAGLHYIANGNRCVDPLGRPEDRPQRNTERFDDNR